MPDGLKTVEVVGVSLGPRGTESSGPACRVDRRLVLLCNTVKQHPAADTRPTAAIGQDPASAAHVPLIFTFTSFGRVQSRPKRAT